jgi:hypothetical protein
MPNRSVTRPHRLHSVAYGPFVGQSTAHRRPDGTSLKLSTASCITPWESLCLTAVRSPWWLPGMTVRTLIGVHGGEGAYRQMGQLLKRLHAIPIAYGYIVADGILSGRPTMPTCAPRSPRSCG